MKHGYCLLLSAVAGTLLIAVLASPVPLAEQNSNGEIKRFIPEKTSDKAEESSATETADTVTDSGRTETVETAVDNGILQRDTTETGDTTTDSGRTETVETAVDNGILQRDTTETGDTTTDSGRTETVETAVDNGILQRDTTETGDTTTEWGDTTTETGERVEYGYEYSTTPEDPPLQPGETPVCPEIFNNHNGCEALQLEGDIFVAPINDSTLPMSALSCTDPGDGNGTQYNWWQILIETGGKPGLLKGKPGPENVTASPIRYPCSRPLLEIPDDQYSYSYEDTDSRTFYRSETAYPRFKGTPKFFSDVRGTLVWTPPETVNDTRLYKIEYVMDDTGFWVLVKDEYCSFTEGIKEPVCVYTCPECSGVTVAEFSPGLYASLVGG